MQQSRIDICGCQVSGGQIEKVYYRSQATTANAPGHSTKSWKITQTGDGHRR
jgi:hypothetical protein